MRDSLIIFTRSVQFRKPKLACIIRKDSALKQMSRN